MGLSLRVASATFTKTIGHLIKNARLQLLSNVTESGDATAGYVYTKPPGTTGYASSGTLVLPDGTDGYFAAKLQGITPGYNSPFFAYSSNRTSTSVGNAAASVWVDNTGQYKVMGGSTVPNLGTRSYVDGGWVRLRRSGSTLYIEVSSDDGLTWDPIHVATGQTTVAVYPGVFASNTAMGGVYGPVIGGNTTVAV